VLELEIQRDIIDFLKVRGAKVYRMNSGKGRYNQKLPGAPGTPDLFVVERKRCYWVEVKGPEGKLNPEQEREHKELRALGQKVVVARSVDDLP